MTIGAPIAPVPGHVPAPAKAPVPAKTPAALAPPTLEERVAELSLYAEAGDAVSEGEIWHVEETAPVFGEDGLGFDDLLDIVNPLHHIPIVGTLYRSISGDTLAPGPRVMGGALFGGVIGFAAALVNAIVDETTGSDIGDKALALITGDKPGGGEGTAVAAAQTAPSPVARAAAATTPAAADTTARQAVESAPVDPARATVPNPALATFLTDRGATAKPASAATAEKGQLPPSEALIRARSAVPVARKAAALGFGGASAPSPAPSQSTATAPGPPANATQASGHLDRPVAKPAIRSVVSHQPVRHTAAALPVTQEAVGAARQDTAARTTLPSAARPPDDIASVPTLMQQALEKYEVLMQARANNTLADDI